MATIKSFKANVLSIIPSSEFWQRANAWNINFKTLNSGQFYSINSVDNTKLPCCTFSMVSLKKNCYHRALATYLSLKISLSFSVHMFLCFLSFSVASGSLMRPIEGGNSLWTVILMSSQHLLFDSLFTVIPFC